jgi:hypothetical protein
MKRKSLKEHRTNPDHTLSHRAMILIAIGILIIESIVYVILTYGI